MKHDGGSHRRAEICRALGQITDSVIVCVVELAAYYVVNLVGNAVCFLECKTCHHDLKSDVILLAEHNAYCFVVRQEQASAGSVGSEFRADKMTFGKRYSL